ncbi:aminotransferase GliI, partial [Mytilinidion resinicola]
MLSRRCDLRNKTIIPQLLNQHGAVLGLSGDAVIDLSTAENCLLQKEIVHEIQEKSEGPFSGIIASDLCYSEGIGGSPIARERIATLVNRNFGPKTAVHPSHVVLAAGGSYALEALVEQICDPGDAVLIAAPYWAGLDLSLSIHNNAKVIPVHVPLEEFFTTDSLKYYEAALEDTTVFVRAVLICNPNNPLGKCYPRDTLQATLDFCRQKNLHYISDEVYALSLHTGSENQTQSPGFISALSLENSDKLVHIIYSLSKDFGCSGIRLGALISQSNDEVRISAALSAHQQTSSVATLFAVQHLLTEKAVNLVKSESGAKLKSAYETIRRFMVERNVEFVEADSGIFIFAKLCPANDLDGEKKFGVQLNRHGLVLSSGTSYHFDQPGWYRICYGVPPPKLAEGLKRIDRALNSFHELMTEKKQKRKSIDDTALGDVREKRFKV